MSRLTLLSWFPRLMKTVTPVLPRVNRGGVVVGGGDDDVVLLLHVAVHPGQCSPLCSS
jgi:hypothetical protein